MRLKRVLFVGVLCSAVFWSGVSTYAQNFDWDLVNSYSEDQTDGRIDDLEGNYYLKINQSNPPSPHSLCDGKNCDTVILYKSDGTVVGREYFIEGTGSAQLFSDLVHGITDDGSHEIASKVTGTQNLRTAVTQTSKLVSNRVSKTVSPKKQSSKISHNQQPSVSGLAAGDMPKRLAFWANASYTEAEDTSTVSKSDSELTVFMIGADIEPMNNMVIGLAAGFEDSNVDTIFNNGTEDSEGFTIAPYFAYLINKNFSFDLLFGYSRVDTDQERSGGAIISDFDSERWFASTNIHGYHSINDWAFEAILGYTFASEDQDAYTESNGNRVDSDTINLGVINVGVEVSYMGGAQVQPYANVMYYYDTDYDSVDGVDYDRDGFTAGLGFRLDFLNNFTSDISCTTSFDRDDQSQFSINGNLRYTF